MTFGNASNSIKDAIIDAINAYAANRPRQLQTAVGASSVGVTCQRQLGYKLLQQAVPGGQRQQGWLPQIGTAVHAYIEKALDGNDRYLTEQAVTVRFNDVTIPGTVDCYDKQTRTVIDFKIVGEDTLKKAMRKQVSVQYQVQVMLYALGLTQAGYDVDNVAILFLPRNKELNDSVMWTGAYDQNTATAYIQRFHATKLLTDQLGAASLASMMTADAPCMWCDWFNLEAKTPAEGCTGHKKTTTTK